MLTFYFYPIVLLIILTLVKCRSTSNINNIIRFGNQLLRDNNYEDLIGERVGILSNPSGVFPDTLQHIVDNMYQYQQQEYINTNTNLWSLVAIFSPEHGFRGEKQAETGDPDVYIDETTGLPVYSAYSLTEIELSDIFIKQNITMLVVDMQDVGVRLYTFIWTMYDMMNATKIATETVTKSETETKSMKFLVLDRPNPIGGDLVEGPLIDMECCASGYGKVPITHIHGMTIGELGLFFYHRYLSNNTSTDSALFDLNLDLNMDLSTGDKSSKSSKSVAYSNYNTDGYENGGGYGYYIKRMDGYRRSDKWSDMMIHRGSSSSDSGRSRSSFTLPWVPPSPNIPTPTTALAYPSTCFLEATTVAEGRGTNTPFELIGAPFILDPNELAEYINFYCMQGQCSSGNTNTNGNNNDNGTEDDVCANCARATYFQPTFSKYNNTVVPGIQYLSPQQFNYELPNTGTYPYSRPFLAATYILRAFMQLSSPPSAFQWDGSWFGHPGVELIDSYAGTTVYRQMLNNFSYSPIDIYNYFKVDAVRFKETRQRYLLYA